MGENESPSRLKPEALIRRLVPDAAEVPDVRVLTGFVGESSRKGAWRLYQTLSLDDYLEFDDDDVVHSEPLDRDDSSLGGTVVWVKRGANVQHTQSVSREAQADFLQGSMTADARRQGVAGLSGLAARRRIPGLGTHHVSCVREFCDIVLVSWLGGGDVFCTGSFQCLATVQAECR